MGIRRSGPTAYKVNRQPGFARDAATLLVCAVALLACTCLQAVAAELPGAGPYPVGTTNMRMTDEFAAFSDDQIRKSLAGHPAENGDQAFFTEYLQHPDDAWVLNIHVPDNKDVYGQISGALLPVQMYLSYPTTADNPRRHYRFPFPDAQDTQLQHMQGPGEQPVFHDSGQRYPLVLVSHGRTVHGLWEVGHARRLASQGYIVLTVNYGDLRISDPGRPLLDVLFRPLAGKAALDHVLSSEAFGAHIDSSRIATSGHSLGGFTSLALAGGRYLEAASSFSDPRVKAVVATAPWVGGKSGNRDYYLFGEKNAGLAAITAPVLGFYGSNDKRTTPGSIISALEQLSGPRFIIELVGQPHIFEPPSWQDMARWELLFLSAYLKEDQRSLDNLKAATSMEGGNRDIQHFHLQRLSGAGELNAGSDN
jgi:dienelactone hydrolase